jgi:hypothetical protein
MTTFRHEQPAESVPNQLSATLQRKADHAMTLTQAEMEAKYDAERNGTLYGTPTPPENPSPLLLDLARWAEVEITLAREADRVLAQQPSQIQIERHTRHTDGSIPHDPWTSYTLGSASIDIQDAGGGNIGIDLEGLEFEENAQMLDLARLLNDPRVIQALGSSREDTNALASILEECDGGESEPEPVPFGELADGTPIMGIFDGVNGTYHRDSCVEAAPGDWTIVGSADGGFAFGNDVVDIEQITMPQIIALRKLLNSDTFERMVMAAEAWGRGDTEPPAFADRPVSAYLRGWDNALEAVFERAKQRIAERQAATKTAPLGESK